MAKSKYLTPKLQDTSKFTDAENFERGVFLALHELAQGIKHFRRMELSVHAKMAEKVKIHYEEAIHHLTHLEMCAKVFVNNEKKKK